MCYSLLLPLSTSVLLSHTQAALWHLHRSGKPAWNHGYPPAVARGGGGASQPDPDPHSNPSWSSTDVLLKVQDSYTMAITSTSTSTITSTSGHHDHAGVASARWKAGALMKLSEFCNRVLVTGVGLGSGTDAATGDAQHLRERLSAQVWCASVLVVLGMPCNTPCSACFLWYHCRKCALPYRCCFRW